MKQFPVDLGTIDKSIPGFTSTLAENPGSPHLSSNAFGSTFPKGGQSGTKPELPFGSTFPKGGKCDPCVALNDTPDYSCPFKLDIRGVKPGVSSVWQHLWGS